MRNGNNQTDPYAFWEKQPKTGARACDCPGCTAEGEYRAPKSAQQLREYYWFCLDHVRQYNDSWDYYAGRPAYEVEQDIRDSTVWERPTWPMGTWRAWERDLRRMAKEWRAGQDAAESTAPEQPLAGWSKAEKEALATLQLSPPVTIERVKSRYLALVKLYHPDIHHTASPMDKAVVEEKLKMVNDAFTLLKAKFKSEK